MRLHVLHDRTGRILAAVRLDSPSSAPKATGTIRPVPRKGQLSAELDVPPEHANLEFVEVCRALRVDTKTRTLFLPRGQTKPQPDRGSKVARPKKKPAS